MSRKRGYTLEQLADLRKQIAAAHLAGEPVADIAGRFDVAVSTVIRAARLAGNTRRRSRGGSPADAKWDAVDWTRTNREIAGQMGVCHQRVQQVRTRTRQRAEIARLEAELRRLRK